jgi:hypothetical protein
MRYLAIGRNVKRKMGWKEEVQNQKKCPALRRQCRPVTDTFGQDNVYISNAKQLHKGIPKRNSHQFASTQGIRAESNALRAVESGATAFSRRPHAQRSADANSWTAQAFRSVLFTNGMSVPPFHHFDRV